MASSPHTVEWLALLSDGALRHRSGAAVFTRGQTYAAGGAIETLDTPAPRRAEQAALQAVVQGTQPYQVRVWVTEDDDLDGACDCPHAQDGNFCKHLVALSLAWRGELGGDAPAHDPQAERKVAAAAQRARTQAGNRDALRCFVQGQSAEALAERLWAWAERDRDCMADLKAWAAASGAADDPKALRATLTELLRERSGYLDWQESSRYAQRAGAALGLLRPWLARDAAAARELCEHALRCLYKVTEHADDSSGDLGGLVQEVMNLLIDTLRAAPPPAAWLERWFALMEADPWGQWHEKTVLDAAGPAVQARYAERARRDWDDWQGRHPQADKPQRPSPYGGYMDCDHERASLRRRYLDSIASQGDPRALLEAMAASAHAASEYGDLIALCETQGWHRESLQWAQAAAKRYPQDRACEDALLRCYERDGWDDEALAIHRKRLQAYPSADAYRAVLQAAQRAGRDKAAYRAELFAWAEQREQAEAAAERKRPPASNGSRPVAPDVSARVQWLMAERDLPAALALAMQGGTRCAADTLETLARKLPAQHHAEAAQLLQRVFGAAMTQAQSPYTRPLELVRAVLERLPPEQQAAWLALLRATYKAKRNFIAGLP